MAAAGAGWWWERETVLAELDLSRVSAAQGRRAMAVLRQAVAEARVAGGENPVTCRRCPRTERPHLING